jgi:quercetin dioxygenase-like cupin family protein
MKPMAGVVLFLACGGWALPVPLSAQQPSGGEDVTHAPIKRTLLLRKELEDLAGKELHVWVAELKPAASTGTHKHPWHEFVYVLDGEVAILVHGKPAAAIRAGELLGVPAGQPHEARNLLDKPTRALVFGLAPKGEPLVVQLD